MEKIQHVDEILKMMAALTGDNRFLLAQNKSIKEGEKNMCEVLDRIEERGIERGIERGRLMNLIEIIRKKMEKNISAEDCADLLETDVSLVKEVYWLIEQNPDAENEQICSELQSQMVR